MPTSKSELAFEMAARIPGCHLEDGLIVLERNGVKSLLEIKIFPLSETEPAHDL